MGEFIIIASDLNKNATCSQSYKMSHNKMVFKLYFLFCIAV